jgi:hypothetical protein
MKKKTISYRVLVEQKKREYGRYGYGHGKLRIAVSGPKTEVSLPKRSSDDWLERIYGKLEDIT